MTLSDYRAELREELNTSVKTLENFGCDLTDLYLNLKDENEPYTAGIVNTAIGEIENAIRTLHEACEAAVEWDSKYDLEDMAEIVREWDDV